MTCTCVLKCRLPDRCAKHEPDDVQLMANAERELALKRWQGVTDEILNDLEWVAPMRVGILRGHLRNRP